jgi:adenine-specific DNA glycosylase
MNGETRRDKWLIHLAEQVTPARNVGEFNYALLDFTMEICSKHPKCAQCPVGPRLCAYGSRVMASHSAAHVQTES